MVKDLPIGYTDTEDPCIEEVINDVKAANDKETNLKKLKTKKVDYLNILLKMTW